MPARSVQGGRECLFCVFAKLSLSGPAINGFPCRICSCLGGPVETSYRWEKINGLPVTNGKALTVQGHYVARYRYGKKSVMQSDYSAMRVEEKIDYFSK